MLDEHVLRRRGAALHAVEHDHIGARLHRQRRVIVGTRRPDLDVDRLLPVRDLAQLVDLDLQIVRPGPVGMPAGRALIDALRQGAHLGDALGDLLSEQHTAAARLRALSHHDLDGVSLAELIRVHAIARRQHLIDEQPGMLSLLLGHATVAGGGGGANGRRSTPQRLLGLGRQRAEAHTGDGNGDLQRYRPLGMPRTKHDIGATLLSIALERIAADRCPQKKKVIEVRQLAFRTEAADVVDAGCSGAMNLRDRVSVEGCRLARRRVNPALVASHQYDPRLSM